MLNQTFKVVFEPEYLFTRPWTKSKFLHQVCHYILQHSKLMIVVCFRCFVKEEQIQWYIALIEH